MAIQDLFNKNKQAQTNVLSSFGDKFKPNQSTQTGSSTFSNQSPLVGTSTFNKPAVKPAVDLAQQAVDLGYVKSVDEYRNAEKVGRDIGATLNSTNLKRQPDVTTPTYPTDPTRTSRTMINAGVEPPPITTPKTSETTTPTLRQQAESFLAGELAGGNKIDSAQLRTDAKLAEKEKKATDLYNQQLTTKARYDDMIQALEKNPEGKLTGALNQEINDLSIKANRDLAQIALQYKIANDDYTGAEKVVNDRISDLKDERNYKLQVFNASMNALQNDLSEREKMELAQEYKLQEIAYDNEIESAKKTAEQIQADATAKPYVEAIANGTFQIKDVPKELQSSVLNLMNTTGTVDPTTKSKTQADIKLAGNIFELINDPALGASTGFFGSRLPSLKTLTGATTDFKRSFEQIKSALTVGNLGLMSGVLSETDVQILANEATKLNLDLSKDEFIKEAKNLHSFYVSKVLEKPFVDLDTKKQVLTDKILLDDPKKTDEEIQQEVNTILKAYTPQTTSFNSAGNASASTIANAIKTVESQGNYNAKGASGEIGAYQFMPSTWKQWAGEFLGDPNAPLTRENQDYVAQAKIDSLIGQGYGPEQIALIWNGGTPKRKSGVNKYGVKYDSGAYADKVLQTLTA